MRHWVWVCLSPSLSGPGWFFGACGARFGGHQGPGSFHVLPFASSFVLSQNSKTPFIKPILWSLALGWSWAAGKNDIESLSSKGLQSREKEMTIIKIIIVIPVVTANTRWQVLCKALYQQVDTIIIPILLVRKLRSKAVKRSSQDHCYKNHSSTEPW